jgi:hypothetical protein
MFKAQRCVLSFAISVYELPVGKVLRPEHRVVEFIRWNVFSIKPAALLATHLPLDPVQLFPLVRLFGKIDRLPARFLSFRICPTGCQSGGQCFKACRSDEKLRAGLSGLCDVETRRLG